jgi:arylsulfatase A-like enzyme
VPNALPWSEWQRILSYVYAHVTQVDAACGLILDALDELELSEDTLVIWTADHGDAIASFGGHLGKEAVLSEEVLRIPTAIRWPAQVEPGQVSQHLVSTVDVPVTALAAAGTGFGGPVHGANLLDLFRDGLLRSDSGPWRQSVACETHGHHWEPVVGRAVLTEDYRYAVYQYHDVPDYLDQVDTSVAQEELYELRNDPYQLPNLAAEPAHRDVLADMRRRLEQWQDETGDPARFAWL